MRLVLQVLGWFLAVVVAAVASSFGLTGGWWRAALLAIAAFLLAPVLWGVVPLPPVWRTGSVVVLLLVGAVVIGIMNPLRSIYRSPQAETELMRLYDARLAAWPTPHESAFVDTTYGRVHVIVAGPENAPPLVLLHASGVASWSWLFNAEAWNAQVRTFAIDTLGDAGKSVLADVRRYPRSGAEQAALYGEILDALGIERAPVVGASEGGFIGTDLALHAPGRVTALVLLGPMGYAGTTSSMVRIVATTFFPFPALQRSTSRWALGDSAVVEDALGEWFPLLLGGVLPAKLRPTVFGQEELRRLEVPVMLVLGENDRLVGDPARAASRAQAIADLRTEVVPSGHMMGIERSEAIDALVLDFLAVAD